MGKLLDFQTEGSKKWILVLLAVLFASVGTFVPPILSLWLLKSTTPVVIISGAEYISFLTLIVSAYFGANVLQKHILKGTAVDETTVNTSTTDSAGETKTVETTETKEA